MDCKGLKGSALRKCMKKYEKKATSIFPNFNKETDTIYNPYSSNSATGISMIKRYSKDPKKRKMIDTSIESATTYTNDKNDPHPYKLYTLNKKQ